MRTLIFFLVLTFTQPIFAQENKILYVHAENGLVLRKEPAPTGEKLLTLPYGSKIKLLSEEKFGKELSVKELSDWSIKGQWLFVTFNGQDGYVFEGFVSILPIPKRQNAKDFPVDFLKTYFLYQIGTNSEKFKIEKDTAREIKGKICGYSQTLNHEILFSSNRCGAEGEIIKIIFPKELSMNDAYLICKRILFNATYHKFEYSQKKATIHFKYSIEGECGDDTIIKETKDGIEIDYDVS